VKYAWIAQHRDSFPVAVMCDVLNVSPSGYYDSIDRPAAERSGGASRANPAGRSTGLRRIARHLRQPQGR